ncbi:hypothetical protein PQG02_06990 [Nostoc sp. UHCC 0926]|uniref:hypothetical protein n=1 Tax=unclassified Nostoc TaxID=2593658 RepID=UPI002362D55F|nr:hypothetical protein [Nostoc sp. UHCC 0926]WDD34087.1 hypothetical protein PQG02_06990 [Nostoc sp. UHCC 0926]
MIRGSGWTILPEVNNQSLIDEIVAQEEQSRISQQTEINKVLVMAIAQLEPQLQEIVQLYY